MRRCLILLSVVVVLVVSPGCSWYDSFCQRFGFAPGARARSEPAYSRAEADQREMREPD